MRKMSFGTNGICNMGALVCVGICCVQVMQLVTIFRILKKKTKKNEIEIFKNVRSREACPSLI